MHVHWHRDDLRVADNRALAGATTDDETVPVFVFDDAILAHAGAPRVAFMLAALAALRDRYRELESELLWCRGDPREALPSLTSKIDADRVGWTDGYSGLARERDAAVRSALAERDVDVTTWHDAIHHEPGSITTNEGTPYAVYTYFWKKWRDREKDDPVETPDGDHFVDADRVLALAAECDDATAGSDSLPTHDELGFDEPDAEIQSAGTAAARERLLAFCEEEIFEYAHRREYPADCGTSRLSADLAWGTIEIREVYDGTEAALAVAETDTERESVEDFQSQLAWREFYTHVLYFNPNVVTENYQDFAGRIEWRDDPEGLQAWKNGETGYPIVDAGMRQLRAEAWMHNRVRMIVASFLTKDLLIDWREGYEWFREKLVDHDTANDTGGWQWAASTGTDAQPYFRVFNPMTQGERYDQDAEYITTHVPELRGMPAESIHSWHELDDEDRDHHAPAYPAPIVDHAECRKRAIETFEAARDGEGG